MIKKKIFCFDLDNVICSTTKNYYKKSKPIDENIKTINKLYEKGHTIKIFTSRYMGRSNENTKKAKQLGHSLTVKQLKSWNVKYHKLIMGKPSFDIIIDDKAYNYNKDWINDF